MKKTLLMAAACVALVSCVKDEVAVTNMAETSNSKITFEAPLITPGTRALIDTGEAYPTTEAFQVIGWWYANGFTNFASATEYIPSSQATYQGTIDADGNVTTGETKNYWATEKDYFWPKNGSLTFQAFSPASLATTVATFTASGVEFADYTIPTTHDVDVLFSERSYDRKASNNTASTTDWKNPNNYVGVDIRFRHALSSIKFNIVYNVDAGSDANDVNIVLTDIELMNMDQKGSFDQGMEDNNTGVTKEENNRHWTIASDNTVITYSDIMSGTTQNVTTSSAKVAQKDVIIMPQTFRGKDETNPQKLAVVYTQNGVEQRHEVELSELVYNNNKDNTNKGFEVGKQYVFNISIGLNKIYFAPVVADWEEVTVTGTI